MKVNRALFLFLGSALLLAAGACRDRDETPKYRKLDGRVTSINLTTGEVEMSWYNPKKKAEMQLKGKLAPDAEILIDGATARLEDVRTDDQVSVEGRFEKRGDQPQLVATKVRIKRTEAASAPASGPAVTSQAAQK